MKKTSRKDAENAEKLLLPFFFSASLAPPRLRVKSLENSDKYTVRNWQDKNSSVLTAGKNWINRR